MIKRHNMINNCHLKILLNNSRTSETIPNLIHMQDLDADIVEDMVKYIYSGRVSLTLFFVMHQ